MSPNSTRIFWEKTRNDPAAVGVIGASAYNELKAFSAEPSYER